MKSVGPDSRLQYYRLSPAETLKELKSHKMGLTNAEAERRFGDNGPNMLPEAKAPARALPLVHASLQPIAGLLLACALLAVYRQLPVIAFAFLIAAALRLVIGTFLANSHAPSTHALLRYMPARARVLRNGTVGQIAAERLVVGDVVYLQTSDMVPADLRLLNATNLVMDDHVLLGGNAQTYKFTHALGSELPLGLRDNLAFVGSQVVSGSAYGVVAATGTETELGRVISLEQATRRGPSPTRTHIERYERYATIAAAIGAILMLLAGWQLGVDWPAQTGALLALFAAASAPTLAITAVLAAGIANRRLRHAGLQPQTAAVSEHIGESDILFFSPAGFTEQSVHVRQFTIGHSAYRVLEDASIIEDASGKRVSKKAMQEIKLFFEAAAFSHPDSSALAALAAQAGLRVDRLRSTYQMLQTFPLDAHRQLGDTVIQYGDDRVVFVYGSPDAVLAQSTKIWDHGHVRTLSRRDSSHHFKRHIASAAEGAHAIALAYRILPKRTDVATLDMAQAEQNLTFLGTIEVEPAAHTHTRELLAAAGKELHVSLLSDEPYRYAITSAWLSDMSDTQMLERLEKGTATFSQLTAEDKLRLVSVAQIAGHSVGFVGTTLEDLPAMKAANVALAASYASLPDVLYAADGLARSAKAIARSHQAARHQLANIQLALDAAVTASLAGVLLVLVSATSTYAQHVPLAINTLQLMGLGLIAYPVITLAFAWNKAPASPILSWRSPATFGLTAAALAYASYLLFFTRAAVSPTYLDPSSLLQAHAATLSFITLALCGWINALFIRVENTRRIRFAQLFDAPMIVCGLIVLTLLVVCLYVPTLSQLLGTQGPSATDWLVTSLLASMFASLRLLQRHTRHHTRRAVIELHHQVHGKAAASRN